MMQRKEILFWRQYTAKMITIQPINNSSLQQSRRFATGPLLVTPKRSGDAVLNAPTVESGLVPQQLRLNRQRYFMHFGLKLLHLVQYNSACTLHML